MAKAADRSKRPVRTSVWLDGKAAGPTGGVRRTDQPSGLDLDRIVTATVALLDADGLGKFSMRKLAGELGVTAMSVYWYVDTKDDLLELAMDAVCAELPVDDADADSAAGRDWRERLRTLAHGYRAVLVRHPWFTTLMGNFLNVGPHAMEFSQAVQRVTADTGLPPERQMGALGATFQFVYGFSTIEGHFKQRCAAAGMTQDEYYTEAMGSIRQVPDVAGYVQSSDQIMSARGGATVEEMRDRDFEVALDVLIAGIEASTP
ncbi:Tetracycline repressor protein class E [Streptomyces sp. YIM 130001]|uniref:TetR/AcrR family transcriptional regulator n=1 Tax=Streptomyces sp. YIM 130001 TaxID=2259644 RepID=UPI000E6473C5|nr:TetR/AcrR family transcriptional regulator [Streptomyces sp. YIM 130001]RII11953.1 Tetracycline repressor protein class E [Streptomyces sp. YIM 130001]